MIVADTDLIAYLRTSGDRTARAREVFRKDHRRAVPLLGRSERRSVIALLLRKGWRSLGDAPQIAGEAEILVQGRGYLPAGARILGLVSASHCSAYDCEFVALAEELRVPLITCDARMLAPFPPVERSPDDFVARSAAGKEGGGHQPSHPSLVARRSVVRQ